MMIKPVDTAKEETVVMALRAKNGMRIMIDFITVIRGDPAKQFKPAV
jgi:arabinogalactan endo-1,4-beta-galactosidase